MKNININNLCISFGTVDVLKNINLSIQSGEFIVLLGPSGCGKSTLLNAIAGLIDVSSGQILIEEKDVTHLDPSKRDIGMVFQSYALYPTMSVYRNLAFSLKMRKWPKNHIEKTINEVADLLQITDLLDRLPAELSGGQRQRVAIGRALVRDVGIFLFDEPLSNLDAKLRLELRIELKKLHQALKATAVYVTHDQVEAMTLADKIVILNDGIIQQVGSPKEVYNEPRNKFVAGFIGAPTMNFIDINDISGDSINISGVNESINLKELPKVNPNDKLQIGVRPEHFELCHNSDLGALPMHIDIIEELGKESLIWGNIGDNNVVIQMDGSVASDLSSHIFIRPQQGKYYLFDQTTGLNIKENSNA